MKMEKPGIVCHTTQNDTDSSEPPDECEESARASFQGSLNLSQYIFSPETSVTSHLSSKSGSVLMTTTTGQRVIPHEQKLTKKASSSRIKAHSISIGYAPPSQYAHLPRLKDALAPNLICMFIGLNPGLMTAISGHAYAHPSNLFWKILHSSGCTPRRCHSTEDVDLPRLYSLGFTNLVKRPTRNGSELKKAEMDAGVGVLEEKIREFKPEAVCIVGKGIWDSILRTRYRKSSVHHKFKYGWQSDFEWTGAGKNEFLIWEGARVFVACSTSGLAAHLKPVQKESIWKELGIWVEERRTQRQL